MKNLFSSVKIINHITNAGLIHDQVKKMLGNKIKKGYALSDFWVDPEDGLCCLIVEQMVYSEEEYTVIIPWKEIDQWVEKNTRHEYQVQEAFQKIKEAYK